MKLQICLLLLSCSCSFGQHKPSALSQEYVKRLADAIYIAEGGPNAKRPYGVLSVSVNTHADSRRVVATSIRNNYRRWIESKSKKPFIEFMADRWCPKETDPKGNRNWKKNVVYFMRN